MQEHTEIWKNPEDVHAPLQRQIQVGTQSID